MTNDSGSNLLPFPLFYRAFGLLCMLCRSPRPTALAMWDWLRSSRTK